MCGDPSGSSLDLSYIYLLAHVPSFLVKSTPVNGAPLFVDLCSLSSLFSFSLCLISRAQVRAPLSFRFSPFVPCSRATAPGAVTWRYKSTTKSTHHLKHLLHQSHHSRTFKRWLII